MNPSARVTSLDALKTFRAALTAFQADAKNALGAAELEIRHLLDWLGQQQQHWRAEVRRCEEEVVRARAELVQRKYSHADRRGWTEPELVLKKAQARLDYAQQKVERTRHWLRVLPREIAEYEGPARHLAGMLDAEWARAAALLEQRIEALEAYVQMTPPAVAPPPAATPCGSDALTPLPEDRR